MNDDNRHDEQATGASRRDFIKLAAGSMGGAILAGAAIGCGGSGATLGGGGGGLVGGPGKAPPLPSGFAFFSVYSPGDNPLPSIYGLAGGITVNDGSLMFNGVEVADQGPRAVYSMDVSYNGTSMPDVGSGSTLLRTGDQGPGFIVAKIYNSAMNNAGALSSDCHIVSAQNDSPLVLLNAQGTGLEPFLANLVEGPKGVTFGGHYTDVDINDNGDLLVTADYSTSNVSVPPNFNSFPVAQATIAQGLFIFPGAANTVDPTQATLLQSTGSNMPGTNTPISRMGLIALDNNQNYVCQVFGNDQTGSRSGIGQQRMTAGIVAGNARTRAHMLSTSPTIGGRAVAGVLGDTYMGPRITNAVTLVCVNTSPTTTELCYTANGTTTTLAKTGGTSPTGALINNCGNGVVDDSGLAYYILVTPNGTELVVSNGVQQKTILKTGDSIPNVNGKTVYSIVQGAHSTQTDSAGRFSFVVDFNDGSQSIVVGIPTS
ncbi:MAG TPA: hypothetical protein PLL78_13575 [Fimbriimonadaceae bacterium]|nr:hypothetical protein [Fimbriimonadaceae bacterium]HRJ97705.1 hypothetical protein [Fimbriimonadaceae bacterium]